MHMHENNKVVLILCLVGSEYVVITVLTDTHLLDRKPFWGFNGAEIAVAVTLQSNFPVLM